MLFAQMNGQQEQPVGDQSSVETDIVQNMACSIGPRVDGILASLSVPQAMGAFVTSGAQGACAGRGQQQEQHTPINGLGANAIPSQYQPSITAALQRNVQFTQVPQDLAPWAPNTQGPANTYPPSTTPTTYPVGSITAFSSKRGLWRIAVPSGAPGLGIFTLGAAYTEVASTTTAPTPATQVTEPEFDVQVGAVPIYKKAWFWAVIAGSVVAVGGGYVFYRRHKRMAAAPAKA